MKDTNKKVKTITTLAASRIFAAGYIMMIFAHFTTYYALTTFPNLFYETNPITTFLLKKYGFVGLFMLFTLAYLVITMIVFKGMMVKISTYEDRNKKILEGILLIQSLVLFSLFTFDFIRDLLLVLGAL